MKFKLFLFLITITNASILFSQSLRYKGHLPLRRTPAETELFKHNSRNSELGKATVWPAGMWMPGEFDESRAVAISWAYEYDEITYDVLGNDTTTTYGWISAQLAHYIADECEVWIRAWSPEDTLKIIAFMNNLGWPLRNHKFHLQKGDDFWIRDFGPVGFYYGSKDSVGFTDLKYYDGRDLDNVYPAYLAQKEGYNNYISAIYAEGGNLMADGFGTQVFSSVVKVINNQARGWSSATTYNNIRNHLGTPNLVETRTLECDGGTGHIDLFLKYIDEQTLMVAKYPEAITAQDKGIIEEGYQKLAAANCTYGRPHVIYRIPHPTNDNGKHDSITCSQINHDARTFVNGLTINRTFIFPSYSDELSGNKAQTDSIIELYKHLMPGYRIVPIDSRDLSPLGGEIHCITMQIPADNPIRIWHPSIRSSGSIQNNINMLAKITNHSGIKKADIYWRLNSGAWQVINLMADTGNFFKAILNIGNPNANDVLEYYIRAESNNGKVITKPITGPWGGYRVDFGRNTGLDAFMIKPKDFLFSAWPNPASQGITINYQLKEAANVRLSILNLTGKEMMVRNVQNNGVGNFSEHFETTDLPEGLYFYSLEVNGIRIATKKLVIE